MARGFAGDGGGISAALKWALMAGCLFTVSNIYFAQPLSVLISSDLRVSESGAALASFFCQIGYALGMLFVVTLGDLKERRGVVLATIAATAGINLMVAASPSLPVLLTLSLALGIASCTPQLLLLTSSALARPGERGKTIGFVVAGILFGILWARTASGVIGRHFGWRSVFEFGALCELLIGGVLYFMLPKSRAPDQGLTYAKALGSLPDLFREEPVLRRSMIYGACFFGAFSVYWTTLVLHLRVLGYGSDSVTGFAISGGAGAFAAIVAGKRADTGDRRKMILIAIVLVVGSFLLMVPGAVVLLAAGVFLMDVGVQAAQVTNLSTVHPLRPEALSRMNTIYMTSYFAGGAVGSALGSWAWTVWRWPGVCMAGAAFGLLALANYFFGPS